MIKKNKTGFSLIELMVVISIISLLSTIILANYREGEKQFALQRSAHQLAQDIRRAQAMTMGAAEYPLGTVPPGYGIYLEQGQDYYILYADTDNSGEYSLGQDGIVEKIDLEQGIYIFLVDSGSLSINFSPPDPIIKIQGPALTETEIIIALKINPSKTKIIKFNKAGLIEVE